MLKRAKLFISAFAAFGVCTWAFAQMKNNDFSEANKSFDKTFEAETKKPIDEKSRHNDEKFDAKKFEQREEMKKTRDSVYREPENPAADKYNKVKFEKSGEKVEAPDRKIFLEQWDKEKNALQIENKDRTLNKDYQGRSDFSKRHPRDAEMREFYEQIQERSLQDINKYMFSGSHSDDPGMPVVGAGSKIHEGEDSDSSFLQNLIFGEKSKQRASVSFKKNMDIGVTAPLSGPSKTVSDGSTLPPSGIKVLPPVVLGEKQKATAPKEKKTTVYEATTDKVLMQSDDKNVKRRKTTIRVEVGEPKY